VPRQLCRSGLHVDSVAIDRHHDRSLAPAHVAFEVEDLLPSAELECAISHRHGKRWPKDRGLQVRVAVAVVPGLFVAVVAARRKELIKHGRQVALKPRLEFNGPQCSCATHIKDVGLIQVGS
jgi:hypothetical protein